MSNTPSTLARSVPVRTSSALARSPSRSPSAPTIIDFPAPVSPDRTLNPPASGRVTDSMIARFLTRSSVSMTSSGVRDFAPAQLPTQTTEIRGPRKADDEHGELSAPDVEGVADDKRRADLAVDG